jgi:hypothetical protein
LLVGSQTGSFVGDRRTELDCTILGERLPGTGDRLQEGRQEIRRLDGEHFSILAQRLDFADQADRLANTGFAVVPEVVVVLRVG